MAAPPLRTEISNDYPNPSNATARAGFGKLWDYVTGLLGATGDAPDARSALGFPSIGAADAGKELVANAGGTAFELRARVGEVFYVPATTAPAGSIKLNGALLSRTTYAALWAYAQASGNLAASDGAWQAGQFSPGDGSTTFRIPDGRAEVIRGLDDGRGVDSGRTIGSAQGGAIESHNHGIVTVGAAASGAGTGVSVISNGAPFGTITTYIAAAGGGETRMRNIALLPCIRYQ